MSLKKERHFYFVLLCVPSGVYMGSRRKRTLELLRRLRQNSRLAGTPLSRLEYGSDERITGFLCS